jgi:hypothetical protein
MSRFGLVLLIVFGAARLVSVAQSTDSAYEQTRTGFPCYTRDGRPTYAPNVITPVAASELLKALRVARTDHVYELTVGDGVIGRAAAQTGARASVFPICEMGVRAAKKLAMPVVSVLDQDFFSVSLQPASVVVLHLVPSVNDALGQKLRRELRRGSRIASWNFPIAGWDADRQVNIGSATVYVWTIR